MFHVKQNDIEDLSKIEFLYFEQAKITPNEKKNQFSPF